jgi:hypothetical protein
MDDIVVALQVVSMFAALGAVYYAAEAVRETRALRREDRIARLLELVADVGETGTRAARGQAGENLLDVALLRLRAAHKAAGEQLPECERLLALNWPVWSRAQPIPGEVEAMTAVDAALKEVAGVLRRLKDEPPPV